jgi:glycosyltransferase involved in cell wall biosynthesis
VTKISILTPSLNQGEFIRKTIESVLTQKIPELDYWVIDGGSTDGTPDVLREFNTHIRWVSEPDRGTANALNKGFGRSRGEIIGWLSSDDIYYPGALHTVLEFFAAHSEIDILYGDANHIDEKDQVLERYPTEPFSFERLKEVCFISQPATFFRRRLIDEFGMLNESFSHCIDYELWVRFAKLGARFHYLPQTLAATRLHPSAKTVAFRVACHEDINNILKNHFGQVPTHCLLNYAYAVIEDRGMRRDQHFRFAVALAKESVLAANRWNGKMSFQLAKELGAALVYAGQQKLRFQRQHLC